MGSNNLNFFWTWRLDAIRQRALRPAFRSARNNLLCKSYWSPCLFLNDRWMDELVQLRLPYDNSTIPACGTCSDPYCVTHLSSLWNLWINVWSHFLFATFVTFWSRGGPVMWRYFAISAVALSACYIFPPIRFTWCWPFWCCNYTKLEIGWHWARVRRWDPHHTHLVSGGCNIFPKSYFP